MTKLEGLSEKIFLDRYAKKNADSKQVQIGDVVLVMVKDDPKFPTKEVGKVIERNRSEVTVELRSGEIVHAPVEQLTLTVEHTPEEMWDRLAAAMASVESESEKELWQERFRHVLTDWKLVPGGRIAAGAGASDELTLFNCYVIPSPKDSRGGIMTTLTEMTEIMARGGGVGINLSSLRPRKAIVAGVNGTSSGSVSWGGLFSHTTGLIEQGGSRRGALMIMLNDWHPDIMEFITVKQTMGLVTNANLSVCVSDAFMEAVKADAMWELVFPDTKEQDYDELWDGDIAKWREIGKKVVTYKTVRAREIWRLIIESAWKSAEPGVVFMERYNKMSNSWYFNSIISTNPCFHPDTRIATEFGLIKISELYKKVGAKSFTMITDERVIQAAKVVGGRQYETTGTCIRTGTVFPSGYKPTLKLVFANGLELKVTPEHRIYTDSGWKEAQQLNENDRIYVQSGSGIFPEKDHLGKQWGMFLGWLVGDGWIAKRGDIGMVFGKEDSEVIPYMIEAGKLFSGAEAKIHKRDNGTSQLFWWRKAFRDKLLDLGIKAVPAAEKEVPECIFTAAKETVAAFVQALFSADGTVYENDEMHRTVRLTSSSKKLLLDVQLLLFNFGIHGHIYSRPKRNQAPFKYETISGEKREYSSNMFFELVLSGNNIVAFKEQIGFKFISRKQAALERISRKSRKTEKFFSKLVSITKAEEIEVYDINEPITNSLIANGIVVHNCGEQGLPAWGVCNLSAVNLSQFYDAERHDVAWEKLGETTRLAVRFLDNVIDKTPYHFEENEQNQKLERRIGLGTMGLAELMIKLGIRYGSADSLEFLDHLYGFMAKEAYMASADIAAEKGSFPAFDAERYLQSGFMKQLVEAFPEVGEAIREKGMRNVTVITQAPTGSTGTMVGTSTGIEPYFAFEYFRQSRLGFDKQYVPIAQQWKNDHSDEEFPEYFVTAMTLSAEDHIRVQAAIQRWVDSSISKTANAPNDFTIEDTEQLYELAYELGCKGVTIYRDGSRDTQVLSTETKDVDQEEKTSNEAEAYTVQDSEDQSDVLPISDTQPLIQAEGEDLIPSTSIGTPDKRYKSRPQILTGATYKMQTSFGKAYITINDINGTPGEIFLNVGKAGSDVFAMAEALGRVCSLFLRYGDHGDKVKLLVKHLKGIGGSEASGFGANRVESIADAVAKALELHVQTRGSEIQQKQFEQSEQQAAYDELSATASGANHSNLSKGHKDLCPSCGTASLINIEGCKQCSNCGYSRC